jgi:PTS system cellobiose-specific IIC component
MKSVSSDVVLLYIHKFVSSKSISAIKDGLIYTIPLTIIGSIFLLLSNLPFPNYQQYMVNLFGIGWDSFLLQVVSSTFDIVSLIGVFGIAYTYTKNNGFDGISAGVLAVVSFLILNEHFVLFNNTIISGNLPKTFLGGKGIIGAIIVGLTVGYIFSKTLQKGIKITLPDGVPMAVANAFTSLLPGFFIILFFSLVYLGFRAFLHTTFIDFIYVLIQKPIQGLSASLVGALLIPLLISLLWWCGVHGSALVMGIMGPILTANALDNQILINNGIPLVAGENAHIVTIQFIDQFITFTGSGITIGLVLAMLFFAKSGHLKTLGKIAIVPGLFNINEPVTFGVPIVFNPLMLVPFILAPLVSSIIVYTSLKIGFIVPFGAVSVPWTTPPLIGGLIVGGLPGAFIQLIVMITSFFIYLPFMKLQDKIIFKDEQTKIVKK